jgi:hypothetical protein
VVPPIPIAPE